MGFAFWGDSWGMKKTKSKSKRTAAKKPEKKQGSRAKSKRPKDMAQARENISNLVRNSSDEIATKVIEVAKTGALASAKYMFEVAGLYPATEAKSEEPEEDSFAKTLLNRLNGLAEPTIPSAKEAEEQDEAGSDEENAIGEGEPRSG